MRRAVFALLLASGLALAGCASESRTGHAEPESTGLAPGITIGVPTANGGAWQPAPAAPGEIVYFGAGIRTTPAPSGARVAVSEQAALRSAAQAAPIALAPQSPRAELRLVRTGDFADGQLSSPRLEWVVTYAQSKQYTNAPIGVTPSTGPASCTFVVFVDAETAADLGSYQFCAPITTA